ncbi:uncharacterized protein LOC131247545 [Magnolia sinica]|uniref:uncharacterized protein LOC131247545 n=1 Tax=Magnolia sinica TaxID=86752 RepID=UPI0026584924|nr:uncharacterized protein LOC131247545 [Magnolia sinica]
MIALSPYSSKGHCIYLLVLLSSSKEHNFQPLLLGLLLSSKGSQVDLPSRSSSNRDSTSTSTSRGDILLVGEMFLPVDLFMIPMIGFDVILGMDWLAKYGVILGCAARIVTFHIPGLPLPVVYEYPDVFQEIPGLPPRPQVEFQIDLVPGTMLISKAPYRMTLLELRQLQE